VLAACVGIGWAVAAVAVVTSNDPGCTGAVVIYVLGATLAGGVIHWLGGTTTARHRKEEGP